MKRWGLRVALLGCAGVMASGASAQTRGGFEAGVELFDYGYRERLEGETIVTDDGFMGGLALGYTHKFAGDWLLRVRAAGATGSIDYSSESGDLDNVEQSSGRFELHAGRDFAIGGGATLTPYLGLGGRHLTDNSGGETTDLGAAGYDREIFYMYLPVGLEAGIPVGGRTRLTFAAQYNFLVGGDATSKFSGIDPELPDVELDLEGGRGIEASAMLSVPLGRHAINFGPFVRHWNIKRSESLIITNPDDPTEGLELFEPRNRTTEMGVRLSFSF